MVYSFLQQLYIKDTLPGPSEESYYRALLADIESEELCPLVYQLLYESGQQDRTPLFFRERLESTRKEALFRNLLLKKESSQLFDRLEAAGIEAIPLKGTLFAETYFGHLGSRYTTDIDILVRPENVEAAVAIVQDLGYDREDPINPDHFHRVFYKERTAGTLPSMIEIHWNLIKSSSANLNIDNLWADARPLEPYTYIKQLSVRHTFYTICLHGTNHNMESAKHAVDIAHLLFKRSEELGYPELFRQARGDYTLNRIRVALDIVYGIFPELHTVKPLPYSSRNTRLASWNNRMIRSTEAHEYVLHCFLFSWRTVDRWKYRRELLRNLLIPSPSLALYSVDGTHKQSASIFTYLQLYRQRLGKLLFPLTKRIGAKNNGRP
jgi:hypothetical protein